MMFAFGCCVSGIMCVATGEYVEGAMLLILMVVHPMIGYAGAHREDLKSLNLAFGVGVFTYAIFLATTVGIMVKAIKSLVQHSPEGCGYGGDITVGESTRSCQHFVPLLIVQICAIFFQIVSGFGAIALMYHVSKVYQEETLRAAASPTNGEMFNPSILSRGGIASGGPQSSSITQPFCRPGSISYHTAASKHSLPSSIQSNQHISSSESMRPLSSLLSSSISSAQYPDHTYRNKGVLSSESFKPYETPPRSQKPSRHQDSSRHQEFSKSSRRPLDHSYRKAGGARYAERIKTRSETIPDDATVDIEKQREISGRVRAARMTKRERRDNMSALERAACQSNTPSDSEESSDWTEGR